MVKILFVCTGNTCRSVMAEKICNNLAKKQKLKLKAESAGIYAVVNAAISENSKKALKNIGIRNIKHKAKQFSLDILFNYDYCVALTQDIKKYIGNFENVFCFQDLVSGATDVCDPYGKNQEEYNQTCEQIQKYIENLLTKVGNNYENNSCM